MGTSSREPRSLSFYIHAPRELKTQKCKQQNLNIDKNQHYCFEVERVTMNLTATGTLEPMVTKIVRAQLADLTMVAGCKQLTGVSRSPLL